MSDEDEKIKNYQSPVAQIIMASSNFINSVKEKGFFISVLLILTVGILAYKYLGDFLALQRESLIKQSKILDSIDSQNDLVAKQNIILDNQNDLIKKDKHK